EAFLWLSESLPVHAKLQEFQRIVYDINFADGQINLIWPRTMGLLPPPDDKLFCEWNLFYYTFPHKTWITYQQVFADPSWNNSSMSGVPDQVKMDRWQMLGFVCLPKTQSCVVELKNVRLVRHRIRMDKPY